MKIANINTKSNYSLLNSSLTIEQIIQKACENKQTHVFLSDSNLYGSIEFIKAAKKAQLIPIVGLEIIYADQKILMFPLSKIGYQNIIKISSFSLQKIDFNISQFGNDVLFFLDKNNEIDLKVDNLYENYHELFAINQANYLIAEDCKVVQIMNAIANEEKLKFDDLKLSNENLLLTMDQFENNFSNEKIAETLKLFSKIVYDFEIEKSEILKFNNLSNDQKTNMIEKICNENLLELLEVNTLPENYRKRLEYEISVISEKGFNDYFLIVYDFITAAKNKNILIGPGRGSVAGSLVAYGLKITMVDPLKYDLLFERFLNPNRATMPDIDVDIMDTRRDEVIEYLFEKYGYEKVAHIITFQRMKSKMALRDVGRVLEIDLKIINRISKLLTSQYDFNIIEAINTKKELNDFYNQYPYLFEISQKLIGSPRQTGKHAAGIVLSEKKLIDVIPIQYESNNITTTQISMDYLEELGLIKMDLLGLSNLTVIQRVLKLIKINTREDMDLLKIPLDNQKVFEAITAMKTLGIFQLESPGMKKTLSLVKPKCLEDISIVSALFRPGPQDNIKSFVARREKRETIDYLDERIKDIIEQTHGIIIYQEQVIQIVQRVANFSAGEADIFRKAISKKQEDVMNQLKQQFIDAAIKNGYSEDITIKIFEYIEKFALYGFNHSHSLSYSLISYWMMYFKIYFPIEFYSIALSSLEGSLEKIYLYCVEIINSNIGLEQPNINISKRNFLISKQKIYFGFSAIKGIGNEISKKILAAREKIGLFTSYEQAVAILSNEGIGESTLQILIKAGCFDEFNNRKYCFENLKNVLTVAKNIKEDGSFLFEPQLQTIQLSKSESEEFNQEQMNLIGYNFSKQETIENEVFEKFKDNDLKTLNTLNEGISSVLIKIVKFTIRTMKNGREMAFVTIEDNSKKEQVACFTFNEIKDRVEIGAFYLAKIKKQERGNTLLSIERVYE